jgi:hypothetical protein
MLMVCILNVLIFHIFKFKILVAQYSNIPILFLGSQVHSLNSQYSHSLHFHFQDFSSSISPYSCCQGLFFYVPEFLVSIFDIFIFDIYIFKVLVPLGLFLSVLEFMVCLLNVLIFEISKSKVLTIFFLLLSLLPTSLQEIPKEMGKLSPSHLLDDAYS